MHLDTLISDKIEIFILERREGEYIFLFENLGPLVCEGYYRRWRLRLAVDDGGQGWRGPSISLRAGGPSGWRMWSHGGGAVALAVCGSEA
jgi:hypothetical protein